MTRRRSAAEGVRSSADERLDLSEGFHLTGVRRTDTGALVEHLEDPEIARRSLHIPNPYGKLDAVKWIEERIAHRRGQPAEVTFAVRDPNGRLVGSIGADHLEVESMHRAQVGYWLARPCWNRGIMTEALTRYASYAFAELRVTRLEAEVFPWNGASIRVLEKVGFHREGCLRNYREKDGELMDVLIYGLLEDEQEESAP